MDEVSKLVTAAQQGDLRSFEELVVHYQPRIFATARRYARRESDIEDIVQEVFIKAFNKIKTFHGTAPFEHWLMRVAVRTCYDFLRMHQRNRETPLSDLGEAEASWLEHFTSNPEKADDQASAAHELVQRALAALSPKSRLVITMLEIEGYSVREISQITGWSTAMVKVRAFRARREMRRYLEKLLGNTRM